MKDSDVWMIVLALMLAALLASMMGLLSYKSPNHLSVGGEVTDTAQTLGCDASNGCTINQMIYGQAHDKA